MARVSDLHRTAFVTGASSGLGRAFAGMLLAEGVQVWGTSRDISKLNGGAASVSPGSKSGTGFQPVLSPEHGLEAHATKGAKEAAPPGFHPVALDLADAPGAEAAFLRAAGEAGGFDLVVNNAGYGIFGEFASVDYSVWQAQLDAMLGATFRVTHAAIRAMRERGRGCLVNVSSLAAEFPLPWMSGYNIAKAGLSALSESLIFETRGTGVTVIDFRPGDYRTGFNDAMTHYANGRSPASLDAAPPPARAAGDLRRALLRRRSGIVRSGTFFQARLAPLLARAVPVAAVRAVSARYFGSP